MLALGIDVSLSRGLDFVVLDADAGAVCALAHQRPADLAAVVQRHHPDIIAIDSPPAWSAGPSRSIERRLAAMGISIFATPADPGDHKFYRWMRVGFTVFDAASDCGYPLYRGGPDAWRKSIEVYPHASAVTLSGHLRQHGVTKLAWRRQVLEEAGVDSTGFRTCDQIDAALAALTGIRALEGRHTTVGSDGWAIVLPVAHLPAERFTAISTALQ